MKWRLLGTELLPGLEDRGDEDGVLIVDWKQVGGCVGPERELGGCLQRFYEDSSP